MVDPQSDGKQSVPVRRRPGRWRRWFVRPLVWIVVTLVVLATVVLWLLHLPTVQQRALEALLPRAEEALGRVITVGDVDVWLMPLTVELTDVSLAGPRLGDPPVATVDRIFVDVDLPSLWRRSLQVREAEVEGLVLFVEQLGTETNLPRPDRREPAEPSTRDPFEVSLGALRILDSRVRYEQLEVPLVVTAEGIEAELLGRQGLEAEGQLAVERVGVSLNDGGLDMSLDGRVRVDREGLSLRAVRLQGAESTLAVDGGIRWKGEPEVDLEIGGTASTEIARRLRYLDGEVEARAEVEGSFEWRPEAWGFRGRARSDRVRLVDRWAFDGVDIRVAGDPNGVLADLLAAEHAGGSFTGRYAVEIGNVEPTSSVELDIDGASAADLLRSLALPVSGIEGRTDGELTYRFDGGSWDRGSGWGEIRVRETTVAEGRLSLEGSIPFTVDAGVVRSAATRLTAENQLILAEARYGLETERGEIGFELTSADLGPVTALLPGADADPAPLWLPTEGSGRVVGRLGIEKGRIGLGIDLDLDHAQAPGLTAESVVGHLDLVDDALENLRLDLGRPGGGALLSGRVPFDAVDGLEIDLDVAGWPLDDVAPWLPFEVPLDGDYRGTVELRGVEGTVVGSVSGRLEGTTWDDLVLGTLEADLAWDDRRLIVPSTRLELPSGPVTAEGTLWLDEGRLDFELDAPEVDLGEVASLEGSDLPVGGRVRGEARVGGTLDQPQVELDLTVSDVVLDGVPLGARGEGRASGSWSEGFVSFEVVAEDWLRVEAGGRLDEAGSELDVDFRVERLSPIAAWLGETFADLGGTLAGTAHLEGDTPFGVERATVEVPSAAFELRGRRLNLLEPGRFRWVDGDLQIDSLYLGEEETGDEVFASGALGLGGRALDLRLQAGVSAEWLELFVPDVDLVGRLDVLGVVRGSLEDPTVRAQAGIEDGRARFPELGQAIDQIDGVVLFDPDAIIVDRVEGRLGRGDLLVGGQLDWPEAGEPLQGRIQLAFDDASIVAEGLELRGEGELVWTAERSGQSIRGLVTLDRARYLQDIDVDLLSLLEGFLRRQPETVGAAAAEGTSIALNIGVDAPGTVRVRNNIADLSGTADLSLRGTLSRPVVFGTIETREGSELEYQGNEYQLERGVITFANPHRIEPLFDVEARTKVAAYEVSVTLFGNLDRLEASFVSDPPLSDAEVLSLLLVGRPSEFRSSGGEGETTAEALLYGQATSLIGRRVGDLLGFDSVRVEPLASGRSLSSARLSVGKRLSSRWYATYSYDPSSTANQRIQLEWQATDRLLVRLTQDDDSYAVDLLWESSF